MLHQQLDNGLEVQLFPQRHAIVRRVNWAVQSHQGPAFPISDLFIL